MIQTNVYRRTPHAARVNFSSLWQKDQGCNAIGQASSLYADGLKKLSVTHLQFFTAVSMSLPGCPRLCVHLSLEMTDFSLDRLNLQCEMALKKVSQCWTVNSPFNSALKAHSWHLNEAFREGKMHLWRWSSHSERCALITQLCWSWTSEAMYFKPSTSSHCSGHILITLLKGTSAAYLQPADSAPTFSRLLYYPLNKREPEWSVAPCNESFSRVMKLVWNKESGSNIKLCPITIITDLFYWLRRGT